MNLMFESIGSPPLHGLPRIYDQELNQSAIWRVHRHLICQHDLLCPNSAGQLYRGNTILTKDSPWASVVRNFEQGMSDCQDTGGE